MTKLNQRDVLSALNGYYQSLILLYLARTNLFEYLQQHRTIEDLALKCGCHPGPLRVCLEFLEETSGITKRDKRGLYYIALSSGQSKQLAFLVEKFIGAYGQTALNLPAVLANDHELRRALVDRKSLARAFTSVRDLSRGLVTAMIAGTRPSTLLDLGCGTGSLLVELAKLDPRFRGIGVDANRFMCTEARRHAKVHHVRTRVRIFCQDARDVQRLPDATALHGASLLNEMFANGADEAIEYLQKLRERFAGRDIWFVDYYGRLGAKRIDKSAVPHSVLHDLIQVLSGQGIPPSDLKSWRAIYRAADCRLIEAHEFRDTGLDWFIHRVRLS